MNKKARWDIQDFGIVGCNNAIWLYCETLDAVNKMQPGNTIYADFKTGVGRDTVKVVRLNDAETDELI